MTARAVARAEPWPGRDHVPVPIADRIERLRTHVTDGALLRAVEALQLGMEGAALAAYFRRNPRATGRAP